MQQPAWDRNILGLWKAAMAGGGAGLAWTLTQIFPLLVETELRLGNIARLDWSSETRRVKWGLGRVGCNVCCLGAGILVGYPDREWGLGRVVCAVSVQGITITPGAGLLPAAGRQVDKYWKMASTGQVLNEPV